MKKNHIDQDELIETYSEIPPGIDVMRVVGGSVRAGDKLVVTFEVEKTEDLGLNTTNVFYRAESPTKIEVKRCANSDSKSLEHAKDQFRQNKDLEVGTKVYLSKNSAFFGLEDNPCSESEIGVVLKSNEFGVWVNWNNKYENVYYSALSDLIPFAESPTKIEVKRA